MGINLKVPDLTELKPRITVFGVGGAGCNAVNNMISAGLHGVEFVVANTDAQALANSKASRLIQMGVGVTEGLGAGARPEIGRAAAEETIDEINDHLSGAHMVFITAGMGGGTGTGSAPIIAKAAREAGILTVGVVTKPFQFEGQRRLRLAEAGITELQKHVDTLIVIPNQNLFRIANEKTTFADAFAMADEVLYSGVACITDLMVKEGLINLDFADVRSVMREMGKAMMGTGEASGERRAVQAAEKAIANPLLDDVCMRGAQGLLISITGGPDMTLFEVDEAASRVREEVDQDANIIFGATFDEGLEGVIRVSVVATGIDNAGRQASTTPADPTEGMQELTRRLKSVAAPAATGAAIAPAAQPAARPAAEATAGALEALERELGAPIVRQPAAAPKPAPAPVSRPSAASAPVAGTGVRIQPLRPEPSLVTIREPEAQSVPAAPRPEAFIPAAPERPEEHARMPRVEDFPAVAQRQIAAKAKEAPAPAAPAPRAEETNRPRGFLARLTQGLAKRDDEAPAARPSGERTGGLEIEPRLPSGETFGRAAEPRPAAPRPAEPPKAEDELEIPAFLRRQAS